jgi:hypothetical protein
MGQAQRDCSLREIADEVCCSPKALRNIEQAALEKGGGLEAKAITQAYLDEDSEGWRLFGIKKLLPLSLPSIYVHYKTNYKKLIRIPGNHPFFN